MAWKNSSTPYSLSIQITDHYRLYRYTIFRKRSLRLIYNYINVYCNYMTSHGFVFVTHGLSQGSKGEVGSTGSVGPPVSNCFISSANIEFYEWNMLLMKLNTCLRGTSGRWFLILLMCLITSFLHPSIHPTVHPCICPSIYLTIHLSISACRHPFIFSFS